MKFNKEELEKLNEEKQKFIKPKIPNNSICEFMITDLSFGENPKKRAEEEERSLSFVHDSFTLRLAITGYLKTKDDEGKDLLKPVWVNTIEYKRKDKDKTVLLPAEKISILEPELYLSGYVVLNKYFLDNYRVKQPNSEQLAVLRYASALEMAYGIPYESAINLMINVAKENNIPVTFADVGIHSVQNPIWETITFIAYRKIKTKKKDGSLYTEYTLYDKENPLDPQVHIYDGETSTKVQELLLDLKDSKAETPF